MGRISRLLLVAALLAIAAAGAGVAAQEEAVDVGEEIVVGVKEDTAAAEAVALRGELQQLRDKISGLESGITERSQELKVKDDSIAKLEKLIEEKSQKIASLQGEITSLQAKGSVAAEEQVGKANARAIELEKQIDKLKKDIEAQSVEKTTLENRANDAEKKVQELTAKVDALQKTNDKQKRKLQNTERALKVAEEELMRVHLEATTKSKQLTELHGAWLPPWLAAHSARYMEVISGHWNEHGKPAINTFLQKASEKSAQAKKWAEPHVETAKMKWVPVKEKLVVLKKNTEPYVQKVSSKSVEIFEASRDAVTPHVVKAKELADPYFQEAKKFSKPYIDQVAEVTKPHVEKVRTTLKPYTAKAVHVYGTFLESATTYHRQAQATILDYLHQHEITKSLATKELVWFLASALLAVPVYVIYRLLMEAFCTKKPKRPPHGGNHGHRRHKRRHADK
ncbi:spindle pole body component 110 [Oryza brachyantha]|uniref:spindle pole body component 110 n=1 Tax=Oryza brachyantha TaxID=4533 RepID=UPI0003EA7EC6|nr:spindle pole body component 110 [Oryza brachyantha]XP_015695702.1 spindle pole body component 110 [Oryza brachyantha]